MLQKVAIYRQVCTNEVLLLTELVCVRNLHVYAFVPQSLYTPHFVCMHLLSLACRLLTMHAAVLR